MLASASPARRFLLESAGLRPEVKVSAVDESGVDHLPTAEAVAALARLKAEAVAGAIRGDGGPPALVLAGDSLLEWEGRSLGKPASRAEVVRRWRAMRATEGWLHTGHHLIDTAGGAEAHEADRALIRFGDPTDAEVDAYATTDEALHVAGPFTLEGMSAPWIESIDGNYGTVTGLSLAVVRRLLRRLGVELIDLWS